jgi:hypothetical protein
MAAVRRDFSTEQVGRVKKTRNAINVSNRYKRDLRYGRDNSMKNPRGKLKGFALRRTLN